MYRVLLVDDEILVRDAIRENINWTKLDCELVGDCQNGQEAAEFVKKNEVDIVLTDICMPYMDGMELSHFLHDNYPDIVIVIFSGFGEFEYAKKAIQYNVSEYLLKPVTAMELTEVLEKMKEKVAQHKNEKKKLENLAKVSQDYRKNAQMIRSKAIEALVTCSQDIRESIAQLESMQISLNASSYCVAVLDLDLYSDMYQIDMEKQQESALMAFVLFNISDEIVSREHAGIAYQEGNNRVCILFFEDSAKKGAHYIWDICKEIQKEIKNVIGMDVSVCIGDHVKHLEELIFSYNRAFQALQYRYLLGGELLLDVENQQMGANISIHHILGELTEALKLGKKEKIDLIFAKIEEEIKGALVEKSRACLYLNQTIRSIKTTYEMVESDEKKFSQGQDELLQKVTEQKTFEKAIGVVKEYAQQVMEAFSNLNSSSGQRQAIMAIDYIKNNYMDPDLNLNSLCNYLCISVSHFSTTFKEVTGETFMDVLIRTRMQKAKELLENTTLKNYEIAEKVGFSDPHYFGISFKKMTGKTPTEYARDYRR